MGRGQCPRQRDAESTAGRGPDACHRGDGIVGRGATRAGRHGIRPPRRGRADAGRDRTRGGRRPRCGICACWPAGNPARVLMRFAHWPPASRRPTSPPTPGSWPARRPNRCSPWAHWPPPGRGCARPLRCRSCGKPCRSRCGQIPAANHRGTSRSESRSRGPSALPLRFRRPRPGRRGGLALLVARRLLLERRELTERVAVRAGSHPR